MSNQDNLTKDNDLKIIEGVFELRDGQIVHQMFYYSKFKNKQCGGAEVHYILDKIRSTAAKLGCISHYWSYFGDSKKHYLY